MKTRHPGQRPDTDLVTMNDMTPSVLRVVTIAGSDSGGGAGIQADLKTFQAYEVFGMSAITAVTAQNTLGVQDVWVTPAAAVAAQVESVVTDIGVDAAKTGMLPNAETVDAVVEAVRRFNIPNLVVDPVMVATSGDRLVDDDMIERLRADLLPLAVCITPNIPEAEALLGRELRSLHDMEAAAEDLCALGTAAAVVTGGHGDDEELTDVLFDGRTIHVLRTPRIATTSDHGTGCTFSAAITAGLAHGWSLVAAVESAQDYVARAIFRAPALGDGHGPVEHRVEPRMPRQDR